MKFLALGLAAVAATSPAMVAAQGVEYQDFDQAQATGFILGTAPEPNATQPLRDRPSDALATQFAALSGATTEAPARKAEPSLRPIHVPLWMQSHRFPAQADEIPLPTSAMSELCPVDDYRPNPALSMAAERRRATWYSAMAGAACESGVPVPLLDAVLIQESRYNPAAISPKGAAGIAQLMPDRARRLGVRNVWDPLENMRGGARYLRSLLNEFGRFDLALAAYNAGEGRVRASYQVPRIRETVQYVSGILLTMRDQFQRRLNPSEGSRSMVEP